jgi:hypothetical protein
LDALTRDNSIHRRIEDDKRTIAEILDEPAAGRGQGIADDPVVLDTNLISDVIAKRVTHAR